MADKRFNLQLLGSGSTSYFASGASRGIRLFRRSGSSEYTGNVAVSGDFSYVDKGVWYVNVDDADSGLYVVKYTTDATTFTAVDGMNPTWVILADPLTKAGGTMTGNINMGLKSITGINILSFNASSSGTIAGIKSTNLVDKSAAATITGNWAFNGAHTVAGTFDFSNGAKIKINGVALSASITADDLNMSLGTHSSGAKAITTALGLAAVTTPLTTTTVLTASKAGFIDVSTASGAVQLDMPELLKANAGAMFLISLRVAGNNLTIFDNAADGGFALLTGLSTTVSGTQIVMSAAGAYVLLMNPGLPNGKWIVLGGNGITIS
jgi:hypothetical protein